MNRSTRSNVSLAAVLLATIAAGCGDSAGPPEERVTSLTVVSGNQQQATVGTALPQPIVVRAADAQGSPVGGVTLQWHIASANGTLTPISATTDSEGRASATWTLGNIAGVLTATASVNLVVASLEATAIAGPATSVTITPPSGIIDAIAGTLQLQATSKDSHDNPISGRAYAWTSSNAAVATVDGTGLVRAVSAGTTTIRATLDGATGEAQVMVQPQPASIFVSSTVSQLTTIGSTAQFTASAQDRNGNVITLPATAYTWTSTNDAVATVNASGLATAKGNGVTLIRAAIGSVNGAAQLTVAQTPVSLAIAPQVDTLTTLKPVVQLMATALDANNQPIPNVPLTWTSADGTIATVTSTGLVSAVSNGTVRIRATTGTLTDSATIVVRLDAPPKPVADHYVTQTNTSLVVATAMGVLANDTLGIPAGVVTSFGGGSLGGTVTSNLAASTVMFGTGGSLRVNQDGSLTFTPSTGFNGTFTFQYRVTNSVGVADATVSIDVGTAPTAMDDAYMTNMNVTLNVAMPGVITNDTPGFPAPTVASFGGGVLGGSTVTTFNAGQKVAFGLGGFVGGFVQLNADGSMSVTPPTGFTGTFSFQYRLSNGIGSSDATVTITVS